MNVFMIELTLQTAVKDLDFDVVEDREVLRVRIGRGESAVHENLLKECRRRSSGSRE